MDYEDTCVLGRSFHTFGLTNSITETAISSEKLSFKIFCISYFNNYLIIGIFLVFIQKNNPFNFFVIFRIENGIDYFSG